jgi:hypothetical protein
MGRATPLENYALIDRNRRAVPTYLLKMRMILSGKTGAHFSGSCVSNFSGE